MTTPFTSPKSMPRLSRRQLGRRAGMLALTLAAAALPAMALAQATPAAAQATPARLLVGFPPGGSFDAIARVLADKLKDELQRPVVVENRPGAGGRLAVDALKAAPADGSVVMLGPDALTSIYPLTVRKLSYDPKADLAPISTILDFPFAFAVGTEPNAKTLAEYIAWAKANPARANFGHPARGATHHFLGLMLGNAIGVPMQDVPFQGSGPMMVNLMGGQISSGIELMGGMLEHHKSGKLRILAVTSPQRMPQAPDLPTFAELGLPAVTGMGFNALYAPARTPAAAIATWNQALRRVLDKPDVKERFQSLGYLTNPSTPEEAARRSAESLKRWEPVIKASGFTMD